MALLGGYRITRTGILFVIGIIVLGGLVTGGIFLVENHGEAVRREEAVKLAEQNLREQSQTSTQPVNGEDTDDTETVATNGTAPVPAGTNASELPVTGIDDLRFLGQAAILALLALSASYYIASRRATDTL